MNEQTYLISLRVLHIFTGVFWAGATIYLAYFVAPAVKALGPDGGKFMQQLARTNRLPVMMSLSALLNVLCGVLLLWELSNGFQGTWMASAHGMILSVGGVLAIIAFLEGLLVTRPAANMINKIGHNIAQSASAPTAEQSQQLMALRNKIFKANNLAALLLVAAVILMSIVKYI